MQNVVIKHSLAATAVLFAVAVIAPAAVNAQPARAQEAQQQVQERRQTAQQTQPVVPAGPQRDQVTQSQQRRETGQARLEAAELKACQKREKAIQNIMARMSDRGAKQLAVFTKISDRTQAFYAEKGKTLSNYDALVTEVEAKKAAAEAVIEKVKDDSTEFKCDGNNPKAVADSFKENLKNMNTALKEYRTAIKDLIVGVKSVQSTTTTEGSTEGSQE